jgi:hypothetical protein
MQFLLNIETDHDFSILHQGTLYAGHEETILLSTLNDDMIPIVEQLSQIEVLGPFGGPRTENTKCLEFIEAIEAIKQNPNQGFNNQGGNRGVEWTPLLEVSVGGSCHEGSPSEVSKSISPQPATMYKVKLITTVSVISVVENCASCIFEKDLQLPFVPFKGLTLQLTDGEEGEEFTVEDVRYHVPSNTFCLDADDTQDNTNLPNERCEQDMREIVEYYQEYGWTLLEGDTGPFFS